MTLVINNNQYWGEMGENKKQAMIIMKNITRLLFILRVN